MFKSTIKIANVAVVKRRLHSTPPIVVYVNLLVAFPIAPSQLQKWYQVFNALSKLLSTRKDIQRIFTMTKGSN